MIRTDQTSLAPPPLPPRLGRSHPILIPAQLPPPGNRNKAVVHFLACVVILHLMLSVGGFIYLYHKEKTILSDSKAFAEKIVGHPPIKQQGSSSMALVRLTNEPPSHKEKEDKSGFLKWDKKSSILKNVNFYEKNWLTILESGDYHVYSRVTFSKGDAKLPLASWVKLRKLDKAKEKIVMKAYCYLNSSNISGGSSLYPQMCTATQMEVLTLERGDQLSVWVHDLSLVDYEDGATTFGMYKV